MTPIEEICHLYDVGVLSVYEAVERLRVQGVDKDSAIALLRYTPRR